MSVRAVSYTHLDVYKRQTLECEMSKLQKGRTMSVRAVSYTHLDVYKRQTLELAKKWVMKGKVGFEVSGGIWGNLRKDALSYSGQSSCRYSLH
ncbi:hypothetical protein DEO72_LG4g838 [Vigna unguiculata]|uniref:Uncharacterized protein n=1 Tax=Vigna unguiculata TaxID=3917 RepID=A0A4D6LNW2_VIGUN|nr:hypothetical protein DEO72_LG4g838 [Vigna unguiculata]